MRVVLVEGEQPLVKREPDYRTTEKRVHGLFEEGVTPTTEKINVAYYYPPSITDGANVSESDVPKSE